MYLSSISNEVLLAIVILVAGWIFSLLYDYVQERIRLKERSKYFTKSLGVILPKILSQAEKYKEVAEDISDVNKTRYKLGIVTGLNFHFFQPNIVEDLHSYLSKRGIVAHLVVKDITSNINGIEIQVDHFKSNYSQFKDLQATNYANWNHEVNTMLNEYDELFKEDSKDGERSELVKNIRAQIGKWFAAKNDTIEYTTENLVKPILRICEDSEDVKAINIKRQANGAINFYENMGTNIIHYKMLFEKDSEQAKEFHSKLDARKKEIGKLL